MAEPVQYTIDAATLDGASSEETKPSVSGNADKEQGEKAAVIPPSRTPDVLMLSCSSSELYDASILTPSQMRGDLCMAPDIVRRARLLVLWLGVARRMAMLAPMGDFGWHPRLRWTKVAQDLSWSPTDLSTPHFMHWAAKHYLKCVFRCNDTSNSAELLENTKVSTCQNGLEKNHVCVATKQETRHHYRLDEGGGGGMPAQLFACWSYAA